jgi:hypothetical protein
LSHETVAERRGADSVELVGVARLAYLTCGVLRFPIDDERNRDFVELSGQAWAEAESSGGYLGNVEEDLDVRPPRFAAPEFRGRCAITLTFWADLDSIRAFVYRSGPHPAALRRRRDWFVAGDWPLSVGWWFNGEQLPDQREGVRRYDLLDRAGPGPTAFDLRHAFASDGARSARSTNHT